ncbi:hypothetical protein LJC63_03735 [Ruminococcaceae bacterium OttesenSCG-928-L11]|nr:hypothetical protein [Ruminococcaceae bacterium OttesenSCG-928-L11]
MNMKIDRTKMGRGFDSASCDYGKWLESYNRNYETLQSRLHAVNAQIKGTKEPSRLEELHRRRKQLYEDMANLLVGMQGLKPYVDAAAASGRTLS